MSPGVLRRKAQKKSKRRRYSRCTTCGDWAICRVEGLIPVKRCRRGHVEELPWLGGGNGRRLRTQ